MDGRTYYALSASGPRRGKKERLPGEGERPKKWAWFISVWGKPGTIVHRDEESMDVDEEDAPPNTERWWTFTDVHEMRQLSKWLTFRADADMSGEDTVVATSMLAGEMTRVTDSSTKNDVAIRSKGRSSPPLSALVISNAEDEGADRVDIDLSQPPTQAGVKTLAKSVLEFADFIEWRMANDEKVTAK